ncbi:hypothetical protein [Janthinobacterium agaricidamnosum]|uniref:Uncharacterized protein n=1 Tax=Janthinobacterium agaricidamnosum NBRC 102515 = DSM 9628 TaxID=1349767 RepID=W0V789_9BURK|nr:hypothetical protein [Janthinobacterium agaricidamnosum]CDG83223.1 hypothetical protein GJA_2592 [Janthinobacterium agaricidamnosum NBRC 102515 = DSM 9628]
MNKLAVIGIACALSLIGVVPAHAAGKPAPLLQCPVAYPVPDDVAYEKTMLVFDAINQEFGAIFGADYERLDDAKVIARIGKTRIAPEAMTRVASLSGCAALIDITSSCSQYFSPEIGGPLFFLMEMKKTAPLRVQYDAAISALPDPHQKAAALQCIKLVAQK